MSFLKGKLGRSAAVVAFSLGAFQALSVVGATPALAAGSCSVASGVITVSVNADTDSVRLWRDVNGGIHASFKTAATPTAPALSTDPQLPGCTGVEAGVATTTAINITGGSGLTANTDQFVVIDMAERVSPGGALAVPQDTADWGTINWTVSLGNDGALGDAFIVDDGNTSVDAPLVLNAGANGVDLNTDGDLDVTVNGAEINTFQNAAASLADNTIDLSGSTAAGAPFASDAFITDAGAAGTVQSLWGGAADDQILAGAGNDWIGPGLGNDNVTCAGDGGGWGLGNQDTLDYSNTATVIVANLSISTVTQGTELDTVTGCENVVGTALGDTLTGDGGNNTFQPGDGDDKVDGAAGGADRVDYTDAAAGVTVDLVAGTETGGSGNDTLTGIEDVEGSDFADDIMGNASASGNYLFGNGGNDKLSGDDADNAGAGGSDRFDGGSGIDTVSYVDNTEPTEVHLAGGAVLCTPDGLVTTITCTDTNGVAGQDDLIVNNTVENAILGAGDDFFTGSAFNNIVWPNGGQNSLNGGCSGGGLTICDGGIDTLNYSLGYTAGVFVNLTGGGGTGGAQDSITSFENAVGTAFNDTLLGTDVVGGTNGANLLVGGKGNDSISANAGPDLVRAGAGNDRVRGGSGDDTLKGQGGKDSIRGGQGDDDIFGGKGKDFCVGGAGHDLIKTCERPRHNHQGPNGPGVAHVARLSALKP